MSKRVILYARASSDGQAHSVAGQLADLREFAEREGHEVVAEVRDQSEKRHTLERPGVDELLDLTAGGGVDEIWSWAWDRYGEFPIPEQLSVMLASDGVTMRALDDAGEGEDAEDLRVIKSLFSRREQRSRARRTRKGMRDKAKRGEPLCSSGRPRYGFAWRRDGDGKKVGYVVDPETMANVRRVFDLLAGGESVNGVRREMEGAGIPAPAGGPNWSSAAVRRIALNDVYRPHRAPELAGLVSAEVFARLDPGAEFGIAWAGQRRTGFKPGKGKTRVAERTDRSEWIAVPVGLSGSGLDRAVVDGARAAIEGNRVPAKLDGHFYELSGGVLRCGECGRAMGAYRRKARGGTHRIYYRCRPAVGRHACPNRASHRAEQLEHDAAGLFEEHASRGALLRLFDEAVERQSGRGALEATARRRATLSERLGKLAAMRRGFQDQAAENLMTLPELGERLAELDEEKAAISGELGAAEDEAEAARRIAAARDSLLSATWFEEPDSLTPDRWPTAGASPEELRKAYRRYGARFELDAAGTLTLRLELDLGEVSKSLQEERTS